MGTEPREMPFTRRELVKVVQLELAANVQKAALDFAGGEGACQVPTPTYTRSSPRTPTRWPTWASSPMTTGCGLDLGAVLRDVEVVQGQRAGRSPVRPRQHGQAARLADERLLDHGRGLQSWLPENIGLRPKVAARNESDTTMFTQLSKTLAGQRDPERTMRQAKEGSVKAIDDAASLARA